MESKTVKIIKAKSSMVLAKGWQELGVVGKMEEMLARGYKVPLLQDQ